MITPRNLSVRLIGLILAAVILASCHNDGNILETVPAESPVVLAISPARLEAALNGKDMGGKLSASQTLERILSKTGEPTRRCLTSLIMSDALDRDMLVAYAVTDGQSRPMVESMRTGIYTLTFIIKDEAKLIAELHALNANEKHGFDVYSLGDGTSLLIRGRQGWIVASSDCEKAVEMLVDTGLEIASNKSIASVRYMSKFLSQSDCVLRMACVQRPIGTESVKGWLCLTADFDNNGTEIEFTAKSVNLDGKETDIDASLKKIDSSLLKYLSPTDMIAFGIGIPSDIDWDKVTESLQAIIPMDMRQKAVLAVMMPYMKRIDGTILIAAGSTTDSRLSSGPGLSNDINFFVGIQLDKRKAAATLTDFSDILTTFGIPPVKQDDTYVWQIPGVAPVRMFLVNGNCLVLTNRPLEQLGNDRAAKAMKGNTVALWADIPNALAEKTYGGRGFRFTLESDETVEASFGLNGSTLPLLEQLADAVSASTPDTVVTDDDELGFTPIDTIR